MNIYNVRMFKASCMLFLAVARAWSSDDFHIREARANISWPDGQTLIKYCKILEIDISPNADLLYREMYDGKDCFQFTYGKVTTPDGKVRTIKKAACKSSNLYESESLHSEHFVAEWHEDDLPQATQVTLEYQIVIDDELSLIRLPLTDECDIEIASVSVDSQAVDAKIVVRNTDELATQVFDRYVQTENVKKGKAKPYDGGVAVAGPSVDIYRNQNSGKSWADVAVEILNWWKPRNLKLNPAKLTDADKLWVEAAAKDRRTFENYLRYTSIPIGTHKFIPDEPQNILERRFGDCKDLSVLYCSLMNGSGKQAFPVLVNVPARNPFDVDCPSPYQFNHCIVGIPGDRDTAYYDPTTRGYSDGELPWALHGCWGLWLSPVGDIVQIPTDNRPILITSELAGSIQPDKTALLQFNASLDSRLPKIAVEELSNEQMLMFVKAFIDPLFSPQAFNGVELHQHDFLGQISLQSVVKFAGEKAYIRPNLFQAAEYDISAGCSSAGFFMGRPKVVEERIDIKLPFQVAEPFACSDSVESELGVCIYQLTAINDSLSGFWRTGLYKDNIMAQDSVALRQLLEKQRSAVTQTIALPILSR